VITAGLGIEVSVPPGWIRVPNDEFPVAFAGPIAAGSHPTIALAHEEFDPPTADGLAAGIALLRVEQATTYDGYELLAEREEEIDGRWAYVQHFRWQAEVPLTQLLALIVLRPGLVLKVDGACLTELADHHLPVLDEIVRSVTSS
jgi:hypothetical protein